MCRPRSILLAAAALILAGLPAVATAQQQSPATGPLIASTCGWAAVEAVPEPAMLRLIEERLREDRDGYAVETARDGLAAGSAATMKTSILLLEKSGG